MKKMILPILLFLLLPTILAIDLKVNHTSSDEVMIMDINQPTEFELEITNLGKTDDFQFYNLWGFVTDPITTGTIAKGETKKVILKIFPRDNFQIRGFYTFIYGIRATDNSKLEQELIFKIIDLEDAFKIGVEKFDEDRNQITIYIQNLENFNFEKIDAEFNSAFFNIKEEFSLLPNSKRTFKINLDKTEFSKLKAGFYTITGKIVVDGKKSEIEGIIEFEENENIKTTEKTNGLIIKTTEIKKENEGNVLAKVQVKIAKNIISRFFTSVSITPDLVERDGLKINYVWERELEPGRTLEIKIKTNWTLPFIILILIGAIIYLVKFYSKKDIVLKKKVTFIHSKSGEFALKVSIFVHSKKYLEKVNIIDRLPPVARLYHKFGGVEPTRASEEKRRIDWNFEKLEEGEVRMLSYVIYSKLGVLGKFALPKATAIYEDQGQLKEAQSNQTFFLAEALHEQ